jgi:glycyl-tRNA synthetase beta chain
LLSKADLVTQMVGEFPSLQGIVGREYALADGEDADVAQAIAEHYQPRSARGELPGSLVGQVLALADKLDGLVGCFAAGLGPTGNQDPYALRRQTAGIIRIILSTERVLSLRRVLTKAASLLPEGIPSVPTVEEDVTAFVQDRLYYYFLDTGVSHDIIRAALKPGFDDILDLSHRLSSLTELAGTHDWHKLVTAVERTHNITREFTPEDDVNESLLSEPAERELYQLYAANRETMLELIEARQYPEVCKRYETTFTVPLHVFFEKVFVNVDDDAVRKNRLTLLKKINGLFAERVADLSQILIEDR